MNRTSSIIPWKKSNLSVHNIRKVYFASLLSVLKKHDRGPTHFEIARHLFSVGLPRSACAVVSIVSIFTIKTVVQLSATSLIKSVTSKLSTNKVSPRTTQPKPKGKAVEEKKPLGSQSLTENIIAQFCKFVEPPKNYKDEPNRLVLPQVARVIINYWKPINNPYLF